MDDDSSDVSALAGRLKQTEAVLAQCKRELDQYRRERLGLENLLSSLRSEYQTTVEFAAVGIAHVGPDGRFLHVNPFLCEMLGYEREELLHRTFQEITYWEDLAKDIDFVSQMLEGRMTSYAMEKRYVRKDSRIVWGHLTVSLVRDSDGCPDYFISFIKNIDERKRAKDEVERSRTRLKAVLETLEEGVFVFDHEGDLLEVNTAAMKLCGYEQENDVSAKLDDLAKMFEVFDLHGVPVPPEDWPIAQLLDGKSIVDSEFLVRNKGTDKTWIGCFSGSLVHVTPDEPPLLVVTVQDVTTRKKAEESAWIGKERLRLGFEVMPDALLVYDRQLRIRDANKAFLELVGLTKEELVGKLNDEVGLHFFSMWRSTLQATFSHGTVQRKDVTYTDGTGLHSLMVTCLPLVGAARKISDIMVICHDYTERERAEERARHAALHDPLTGLPNRALLFEYARHMFAGAARSGESVAVLFLDLDRFKPINDVLGHSIGDLVLREVALRLKANVRGQDIVFRLGGDEFLVLLAGLKQEISPVSIACHLLDALNAPCSINGTELSLSASVGISIYPNDAADIDTLITQADAAMYESKQAGKNHVCLYTQELARKIQGKQRIEQALKKAIAEGQLCLHYQPLVSTRTNEVVSLEALVRMTDSEISPEHFVPIAESSGLIAELSNWVLEEICEQLAVWRAEGLPHIPVAVNVSALQFRNKAFIDVLISNIRKGRLKPDDIQIELTETAVMEDVQNAIEMLQWLRTEGVKVSLDDFGTGYSSLNYLSRLPLDKIKVDKSFIHRVLSDSGSRAITNSIIALGQSLGLKIVAEGIELEDELAYVRGRGCDEVQGYYVCKPVAGDVFSCWYRTYSGNGGTAVN